MFANGLLSLVLLSLSLSAQAAPRTKKSVRVIQGSFEMLVCMSSGNLNVRGDDLDEVLFSVGNHEPLKVFQGWGENRKSHEVNGSEYRFVKVQFPNREAGGQESIGWVADSLIKPRSECAGAQRPAPSEEPEQRPAPRPGKPRDPREQQEDGAEIRGLNDPNCCRFPVQGEPTTDFDDGMRRFGSGRSGGRLHAACDLYRYLGEPISSVAPGTVIRGKYEFYQGTYAIEVRHSGGFVVRYGEVTGKSASGVGEGSRVQLGQTVAYMGKVNSNCCEPMLHFELYSGSSSGSLSNGNGPFRRRKDLLNPTQYLRRWQSRR